MLKKSASVLLKKPAAMMMRPAALAAPAPPTDSMPKEEEKKCEPGDRKRIYSKAYHSCRAALELQGTLPREAIIEGARQAGRAAVAVHLHK